MRNLALIVLDVQLGNFLAPNPVYRGEELLQSIKTLIAEIRLFRVPIIFIQHNGGKGDPDEPGTPGWKIHPFITPQDDDVIIQKSSPDAFLNTQLQLELDSRRIKRLIIVGIQSEYCIDTTCRRAYSLGYEAILVEDAHSTWDSELLSAQQIITHHNSVLGGWFVTCKKTNELIEEIKRHNHH